MLTEWDVLNPAAARPYNEEDGDGEAGSFSGGFAEDDDE
jgi:hypothetical protein